MGALEIEPALRFLSNYAYVDCLFLSILMTAELEEKAEATGSEVNGVVSQNLEDLVCDTKAEDVKDVIKEGVS